MLYMEVPLELNLLGTAKNFIWKGKKHKTKPSGSSSYHSFKPLFFFFFFFLFFSPKVPSSQLWKTSMYIYSCDLLCSSAGQKLTYWLSTHWRDILNGHLLQQSFLSTKMSHLFMLFPSFPSHFLNLLLIPFTRQP